MDASNIVDVLSKAMPAQLCQDLVDSFVALRQDVATDTMGRSAPGKFVETFVQILQFLDSGRFDANPKVDEYLRGLESRASTLDDGLRICASRIGRAMYALRSKRSIVHKGEVDPNKYDLRFLHSAAQWALAELVRTTTHGSMAEAGKLIEYVQIPIGGFVEDFGERRLVLHDMSVKEETLVLLHSHYPEIVPTVQIISSLDRRNDGTVRNTLRELWRDKLIEGGSKEGYKLTQRGFRDGIKIISRHVTADG